MKVELGCNRSLGNQGDVDKCTKSDDIRERLDFPCKDGTPGSTNIVQRGSRVSVQNDLKRNTFSTGSGALQQALCRRMLQAKHLLRQQQQQQQQAQSQKAIAVHWDKFLPQKQLQVLLVDDDDATRHIVSALLHKCGYEVASASSGLLAWQLLMDQATKIDLVLTEVVMPFLSGIGLLGRIMNHESFKHIPVIMMSSHDSMNVVLKCLSKGAVDFLVKPVRKNELKNLWQHVWRRCHNKSSGSRCGSGSPARKTSRPNFVTNSSESGTSLDSEDTSDELNLRDGSDHGSGTQSPWIKRVLEVECSPEAKELDVNGLRTSRGPQAVTKVEDEPSSKPMHCTEKAKGTHSEFVTSTHQNPGTATDLFGSLKEQGNVQEGGIDDDLLENHASNSPSSKEKLSDFSSPGFDSSNILELRLKNPLEEEEQTPENGDGVVALSFSRYHSRGNTTTNLANANGKIILPDGFRDGTPAEGANGTELEVSEVSTFPKQIITLPLGDSCDDATASRTLLEVKTEAECLLQYCPPGKCGVQSRGDRLVPPLACSFPANKQAGISCVTPSGTGAQVGEFIEAKDCSGSHRQDEFPYSHATGYSQYHHHSHHHHHHHHIQHHYYHVAEDRSLTRPKTSSQYDDQTVTEVRDGAPRCGSSNMETVVNGNLVLSGSSNGNGSNCYGALSVNGRAIGNNHWSNGDQTAAIPTGGNKTAGGSVEADDGLPDTHHVTSPNENCSAGQEATLAKFKLKRKERSFERKAKKIDSAMAKRCKVDVDMLASWHVL